MKVEFSKAVKYTPEWRDNRKSEEAEQCYAMLKPLENNDLILIMDALAGKKVGEEIKSDEVRKLLKETGDQVVKYAEIHNLADADGPVDSTKVVRYPFYMGLAMELLMQLAVVSMPSDTAQGNSVAQSA